MKFGEVRVPLKFGEVRVPFKFGEIRWSSKFKFTEILICNPGQPLLGGARKDPHARELFPALRLELAAHERGEQCRLQRLESPRGVPVHAAAGVANAGGLPRESACVYSRPGYVALGLFLRCEEEAPMASELPWPQAPISRECSLWVWWIPSFSHDGLHPQGSPWLDVGNGRFYTNLWFYRSSILKKSKYCPPGEAYIAAAGQKAVQRVRRLYGQSILVYSESEGISLPPSANQTRVSRGQWESEHPTRCARSELRRVSICLWIRGSFLGLSLFASRRISERRISVGTNDGAGEAVFSIRHDSQSSSSSGLAYDLPIFVPKEYALKFKHCFSELWVNGAMVQMN